MGEPGHYLLQATSRHFCRFGVIGTCEAAKEFTGELPSKRHSELMDQDPEGRKERLEALLTAAVDGIIAIDSAGIIKDINPAAQRMFGYSADELLGRNVSVLMPEPHRGEHDQRIANYLNTGKKKIIGVGREVEGKRKDGTTFPIDLAVGEFHIGPEKHFTGILKDLSERRALEEQYNHAQKLETVGQLTGGIAHDFNNLLTVIMGNLELLEARLSNESELELLHEAQEATQLGASLTDRLLTFARRQPLEPKSVNLNELVLSLNDMLHRTLGAAIDISTILASDLWSARVDPGQFENALLNLALNARDAMEGAGRLTIETSNTVIDDAYSAGEIGLEPGDYTLVTVSDTGCGMPANQREKAFEPFFTTKETGRGSGLGLSMVYGFAKSSGGHASIYSEPGVGTTVNLYLPKDTSSPEPAREPEAVPESVLGNGEVVLVVEDDDRVRRLSVKRLHELGYRTFEADNGPAALALLNEDIHVDVLFTDLVMPGGISGRELADEIAKSWPEVAVLMTSGYTEDFVQRETRDNGTTVILRKPYRTADLANALRRVIDKHKR